MRNVFVATSNVKLLFDAMDRLKDRDEGITGMALVYGEPGLGKTRAALKWAMENKGVFLRTKKLMTGRWLLEELVAELGDTPRHHSSDLFRQVIDQLIRHPRVIIVDEVDYLTKDGRVIETLRDIYDTTNTPIVFIGMAEADKRLARFKHIYDRFSEVIKFGEFKKSDIKSLADQMCDVQISDDGIDYIYKKSNRFRQISALFHIAEKIAKRNNLRKISAEQLSKRVEN
jgi:DNA transposition AAA+ family ATPase